MKKYAFLFVIMICYNLEAQVSYELEANIGYGYNGESIYLNDEKVKNSTTFLTKVGFNVNIPLVEFLHLVTGVYGTYYRSHGEISNLEFNSNTLTVGIPLKIGYTINDTWQVLIGNAIENNRDFDLIDARKEDNVRYNFLGEVRYPLSEKINLKLESVWGLSNPPDSYTINHPNHSIVLGVIYKVK